MGMMGGSAMFLLCIISGRGRTLIIRQETGGAMVVRYKRKTAS